MKETLKIAFGDLKNRDVQRNDLTDKSSKKIVSSDEILGLAAQSFFRNVYQQALEQISMIVQQNHEQVSDQTNDQLYKHDIQNIIAFTGRRGTGKTSAMMSLAEFLSNHELEIKSPTVKETINATVAFKLLAEIDATSLDENVSLISAILSQIITRLNEELYCSNCGRKYSETEKNTFQEIYKTANQLFTDYITGIHTSSKAIDASNYLSIASKRLSFEKSFRNLIRNYAEKFFKNKNSYFIICIDDVDMAPCNHAELLISIHKYLMIPNIIVMLTANLKFLAPEVQTLFYKNAIPANDTLAVDRLSTEQTEEYLKKIIPSDNRITLPSWKKKDYLSIFPIKISFYDVPVKKESVEEIKLLYNKLVKSEFFDFIDKQSKKEKPEPFSITPKELILMMIANRTKVYLDVCGMKYHFFEPSSLRNMYDLFYILYNMNNIVEKYDQRDSNSYYLQRSQNRKRLLDYIHFTMRRDYRFDDQTSEFLDELIAYPIERRGQKIWGYYYQLLDSEGIKKRIDSAYGSEFRPAEKYFFKTDKYSFGEFFRILYTSSRIGVFDHKFIKFILASYSMALPAFVENEKRKYTLYTLKKGELSQEESKEYAPKKEDECCLEEKKENKQQDRGYKQLVALFGSSLIGTTWCDELFGSKYTVQIKEADLYITQEGVIQGNSLGYEYKAKRCSIVIPIPEHEKQKAPVGVRNIEKLISLLLLSPHWVTETPIKVEITSTEYIINADLDPTSFLINCLLIDDKISNNYDEKGSLLKEGIRIFDVQDHETMLTITELIKEICGDQRPIHCDLRENGPSNAECAETNYASYRIKASSFEGKSFKKQKTGKTIVDVILDYLAEDYRAQHLSNMLKHIDLIYNTIKRTITDIVYITSHDVVKKKERFDNAGEPVEIIKGFYDKLIKQLADTDKIYFADGADACHSFKKRFSESAIVNNVFSISRCNEKRIVLKTRMFIDVSNKTGTTTLKRVFDDILSPKMYVAYQSEYMAALRGQFASALEAVLLIAKAQAVTASIIAHLGNVSLLTLTFTGDNEERFLNESVRDEINAAAKEIKKILDE